MIEAPIEFKPLFGCERQGVLFGRDAVPQVFNQTDVNRPGKFGGSFL